MFYITVSRMASHSSWQSLMFWEGPESFNLLQINGIDLLYFCFFLISLIKSRTILLWSTQITQMPSCCLGPDAFARKDLMVSGQD